MLWTCDEPDKIKEKQPRTAKFSFQKIRATNIGQVFSAEKL
jgi:hypothetical protein